METTPAPVLSECLQFDEEGQFWRGEAPNELQSLANELQYVADDHQDEIAGVALCSEYDGVIVFTAGLSDATQDELAAISERYGNWRVIFDEVAAPLSVSLRVADAVIRDERIPEVVTIGPDVYSGGIIIGIAEEDFVRIPEIATQVDEIARSMELEFHVPVSFRAAAEADLLATRNAEII